MKPLSQRQTLVAGIALILATNLVALAGIWWNRQPPAESTLTLSERELALPWRGGRLGENSGLALDLRWRVVDRADAEFGSGFTFNGGTPEWLDAAHMSALGFAPGLIDGESGRRRYLRQQPRPAVLVLELAGPAWERAVARAREDAARHAAAAAANPDSKEFAGRARRATDALAREESRNSRLFVVDTGPDATELRRKYPDRGRFLLLPGTVRPAIRDGEHGHPRATGTLARLAGTHLQVPQELRGPLEPLATAPLSQPAASRYQATIVVGRRLEPWIIGIEPLSTPR